MSDLISDVSNKGKHHVTSDVLEWLKDILREAASKMIQDHEIEKSHHMHHESHCHHPDSHHRVPLSLLLTHNHDTSVPLRMLGKHNQYNIFQLEVLKQLDPVSCGYHSFHNVYVTLKASLSKDRHLAMHYLSKLRSSTALQYRRRRITELLQRRITQGSDQGRYPWTQMILNSGVMERPYMQHVIEGFPDAALLGGRATLLCLPDLSMGSLKNGIMEPELVKTAQMIFDRFLQRETYSHGFLVGVINHWVAVVVNKYKTEDESQVEVLYLDSRNNPILNMPENELKNLVKEYYDRKEKIGLPVDHRPWREQMYLLSLQNTQPAIELIYECTTGKKHFVSFYQSLCMDAVLSSFESNVPTDAEDDVFLASILSWLSNLCPPKMIHEQIVQIIKNFGSHLVTDEYKHKLLEWANCVEKRIRLQEAEQKILRKFGACLEEIRSLLATPKL